MRKPEIFVSFKEATTGKDALKVFVDTPSGEKVSFYGTPRFGPISFREGTKGIMYGDSVCLKGCQLVHTTNTRYKIFIRKKRHALDGFEFDVFAILYESKGYKHPVAKSPTITTNKHGALAIKEIVERMEMENIISN